MLVSVVRYFIQNVAVVTVFKILSMGWCTCDAVPHRVSEKFSRVNLHCLFFKKLQFVRSTVKRGGHYGPAEHREFSGHWVLMGNLSVFLLGPLVEMTFHFVAKTTNARK